MYLNWVGVRDVLFSPPSVIYIFSIWYLSLSIYLNCYKRKVPSINFSSNFLSRELSLLCRARSNRSCPPTKSSETRQCKGPWSTEVRRYHRNSYVHISRLFYFTHMQAVSLLVRKCDRQTFHKQQLTVSPDRIFLHYKVGSSLSPTIQSIVETD